MFLKKVRATISIVLSLLLRVLFDGDLALVALAGNFNSPNDTQSRLWSPFVLIFRGQVDVLIFSLFVICKI